MIAPTCWSDGVQLTPLLWNDMKDRSTATGGGLLSADGFASVAHPLRTRTSDFERGSAGGGLQLEWYYLGRNVSVFDD